MHFADLFNGCYWQSDFLGVERYKAAGYLSHESGTWSRLFCPSNCSVLSQVMSCLFTLCILPHLFFSKFPLRCFGVSLEQLMRRKGEPEKNLIDFVSIFYYCSSLVEVVILRWFHITFFTLHSSAWTPVHPLAQCFSMKSSDKRSAFTSHLSAFIDSFCNSSWLFDHFSSFLHP